MLYGTDLITLTISKIQLYHCLGRHPGQFQTCLSQPTNNSLQPDTPSNFFFLWALDTLSSSSELCRAPVGKLNRPKPILFSSFKKSRSPSRLPIYRPFASTRYQTRRDPAAPVDHPSSPSPKDQTKNTLAGRRFVDEDRTSQQL